MQSPMKIEPATGLVAGVRQVLSPHFDARPAGVLPELIVVHGISLPPGEFGGPWIDRLFTGGLPPDVHPYFRDIARVRVSAHALIRRDGTIVQYVPFGQRAWHAGQSHYRGRAACNDFSIGIEPWRARPWWATARARPGERPIPDPHSTGSAGDRFCARTAGASAGNASLDYS